MSIKDFKGQVKVADVQAAFDEVVGNINSLVSTYNAQSEVENIDYTVGGANLAPSGYTLTVGGLKQFINAAEGCVAGGKPFRVDDNHFKMSTGMLVARNGIFKLPDKVLTIPTSNEYRTVYYNPYTLDYQWTGKGTISYIRTREVTLGSNLTGTTLYRLNSQGVNDYSTKTDPLKSTWNGFGGTYAQHIGKYIIMNKIPKDIPLKNDRVQLTINDYCYIPVEDSFNYNTEINLDCNKSGFTYGETYYSSYAPQLLFGTLETDGVTFIPKLAVALLTQYPNRTSLLLHTFPVTGVNHEVKNYYSSNPPVVYEGAVIHSSEREYSYTNEVPNFFDSEEKKCKISFTQGSDGDYIHIAKLVDGSPVNDRSCKLPKTLAEYGINVMFLINCGGGAVQTGYSTNDPIDIDYAVINHNGTENRIVTDSRKVTISEVVVEESDTAAYRICDINPNSTSKFIGVNTNVQCEKINGTYKITNETVNYENRWVKENLDGMTGGSYEKSPWYQTLDTSKAPKFVNMMPSIKRATSKHGYGTDCEVFLFGEEVYLNSGQKERAVQMWCPATYLFIPKGVKNPYTAYHPVGSSGSTDLKYSSQKVLNVTITKQIEDSSG